MGQPFTGNTGRVYSVAFSPDGQYILSGSGDDTIRVWDREGKEVGQPFTGHTSDVYSVAFSPDGQYIVSGSEDDTVRVWDRQGNQVGQPFTGHADGVNSVVFSSDGQYIVSGSLDKTIRVWDRQGNQVGQPFTGHTEGVYSVAFSSDGQYIVSGGWDNTVRVWEFGWQNWLRIGCNRLRFHPVIVNPQTESAQLAAETCLQYGGWRDEEKAQFLIRQGFIVAREGKVIEAIAAYQEAQKLNPELDLNPDTEAIEKDPKAVAEKLAAPAKVWEGWRLAEEGKVQEAIAIFKQAQQLDPDIDLDPSTEVIDKDPFSVARPLAAPAKVEEGKKLARKGKVQEAIALYQEAQKLNPKMDLNPFTEAIEKDPFSVAQQLAQDAGVVGIRIDQDEEKRIIITSPIGGKPAKKAGIRTNDIIIKVDNERIEGMNINEAVKRIRGPIDTEVKLTILREGRELDFRLQRVPE